MKPLLSTYEGNFCIHMFKLAQIAATIVVTATLVWLLASIYTHAPVVIR